MKLAPVFSLLAGMPLLLASVPPAAAYSISTRFDYSSSAPVSIFGGAAAEKSFDESVDWNLPTFAYDVIPTGVSFTLGSVGTGGLRGAVGLTDSQLTYAYKPLLTTFVNPAGPSRPGAYRFGSSISVTGGQNGFTSTSTDPYAYLDAYLDATYEVAAQYCFFSLCTSESASGTIDDSWRLFGYRSNGAAKTIELTLLDQVLPALPSSSSYEVLSGGCIKTIESLCTIGSEVGSGTLYAPDMSTQGTETSATRLSADKSETLLSLELDIDGLISAIVGVPLTGVAVDIADILSLSADAVDIDLVGKLKLTRTQTLDFTVGNIISFDEGVYLTDDLGTRYVRPGQTRAIAGAKEFFVAPATAGATPDVSIMPYVIGTLRDRVGLSLCGGIEIDVLKASAGISGFGEWSVGPLYSAEAELGCYELAQLADVSYVLPRELGDSMEVLELGEDVRFVTRALRAPGDVPPIDDDVVAAPAPGSALLLAGGLVALRARRRRPRNGNK